MTDINIQQHIQNIKQNDFKNTEEYQSIFNEISQHINDGQLTDSNHSELFKTLNSKYNKRKIWCYFSQMGFRISFAQDNIFKIESLIWSHQHKRTSPEFEDIFSAYKSDVQSSLYFSKLTDLITKSSNQNKSKLFVPYYEDNISFCNWLDKHQDYLKNEQGININVKGIFTTKGVKITWMF